MPRDVDLSDVAGAMLALLKAGLCSADFSDESMEGFVMLWIPYSIFAGALLFAIASAGLGTIVAPRRVVLMASNAITFALSVSIAATIYLSVLQVIR